MMQTVIKLPADHRLYTEAALSQALWGESVRANVRTCACVCLHESEREKERQED